MIKMFVSDIDGTMMGHGGVIDEQDVLALKQLASEGVVLCFASGRLDNEIASLMKDVATDFHRISVNGVFVYTPTNELLFSAAFEPSILKDLVQITQGSKFIRYVSDEHNYYIEEKTPFVLELEEKATMTSIEMPNLIDEIGVSLHPNKISVGGEEEDLIDLQKQIEQHFSTYVNTFISAKNCLDIVPVNVDKGSSISLLLAQHGLTPHEMACVGDSYNDISMFKLTPHSFAMQIADAEVKQHAQHIVTSVKEAVCYVRKYNKAVLNSDVAN
ncbi:Cof-type HAD-IIB family hydrolase [Ectobacillus sp. JY-23]|uniref:Cof-type HAD-IIB family hydrolase n=1 Tax=Ectobacillus sp. JY-23 TaxID=2933872 RepID=UPI001FF59B0D|nr:Cof-type HAD-IIB family hydrolase [Ectobacillus sp. JY-23]UOY93846.1 Cof-type HAD-IIB family hydrolase [Ectobacillus sp. JY-23]